MLICSLPWISCEILCFYIQVLDLLQKPYVRTNFPGYQGRQSVSLGATAFHLTEAKSLDCCLDSCEQDGPIFYGLWETHLTYLLHNRIGRARANSLGFLVHRDERNLSGFTTERPNKALCDEVGAWPNHLSPCLSMG